MNPRRYTWLIPLVVSSSLMAAPTTSAKKRAESPKSAPATAAVPTPPPEPQPAARIVHYGEKDVIQLKTKIRFTTLIVLPKNEQILDFACGDKEFWIINGSQNFAYVKPAKAATQTNLNLITASGNIYSFVLNEISEVPDADPDLKIFVEPKEQSMIGPVNQAPRFV